MNKIRKYRKSAVLAAMALVTAGAALVRRRRNK